MLGFRLQSGKVAENTRHLQCRYLVQSLTAAVLVSFFFWTARIFMESWAIASLAASTFIAFTFPHADSSRPRYLIGGYMIACFTGTLFATLLPAMELAGIPEPHILCCFLAMVCAMLLMTTLHFAHPPAAALAITLVLSEQPLFMSIAAVVSISVLVLVKEFLKPWMQNL